MIENIIVFIVALNDYIKNIQTYKDVIFISHLFMVAAKV